MARRKARERKSNKGLFTRESMLQAVSLVKEGTSLRKAARLHNVNYQTLSRYVKKMKDVNDLSKAELTPNYATRQVFSKELEHSLSEYILECCAMGYGLAAEDIRRLAYELASANELERIPKTWVSDRSAGEEWFRGFMARHPNLSLRKAEQCSIARAMAFNKPNVQNFFKKLEEVMSRHESFQNGTRVYNLDETGTTTVGEVKKRKIVAEKGTKQVHEIKSAERGILVTTCCIIGANGSVVPPVMIFPRKKFKNNMLVGAYPGTKGFATKKGWMTSEIFVDVLKHFISNTKSSKEAPTLLILDNVASHLSLEGINLCRDQGVTLFTFPPHTTHKLQPLDVCVYGPFQSAYSKAYRQWTLAHPGEVCSIYDIAFLVNDALCKAATPSNVFSAFRSTGIFPLNPDIFDDKEFVPSKVSEKLNEQETVEEPIPNQDNVNANVHEELQEEVPSTSNQNQTTPTSSRARIVSPRKIRPLPKAKPKEGITRKPREKGRCMVATDSVEKNEMEAKQMEKKRKEAVQEERKNNRAKKNLEKLLGAQETGTKRKKKNAQPCKNSKKVRHDSSSESSVLNSDIEMSDDDLLWEGDEGYDNQSDSDPESFKPLDHSPEEGDYVLVVFEGKDNKYYVGNVLKEVDEDGDLEVKFYRKSEKTLDKFVLPTIIEISSVHINSVKVILPKPISSGTARQRNLLSFNYDFSMLRMG